MSPSFRLKRSQGITPRPLGACTIRFGPRGCLAGASQETKSRRSISRVRDERGSPGLILAELLLYRVPITAPQHNSHLLRPSLASVLISPFHRQSRYSDSVLSCWSCPWLLFSVDASSQKGETMKSLGPCFCICGPGTSQLSWPARPFSLDFVESMSSSAALLSHFKTGFPDLLSLVSFFLDSSDVQVQLRLWANTEKFTDRTTKVQYGRYRIVFERIDTIVDVKGREERKPRDDLVAV
jgi:hypothetical protein